MDQLQAFASLYAMTMPVRGAKTLRVPELQLRGSEQEPLVASCS